jgi:YtkA-like
VKTRRAPIWILAVAALACASGSATGTGAPTGPGWDAVSENGRLAGRFAPDSGAVQVGSFQTWTLQLRGSDGEAVSGAEIAIGGGMPAHGHGLPTQPRVTAELPGGRYRVEGVQLNMYGAWVFVFDVRTATLAERLRFDLDIDY